jgi:hypothetical protein
MIGNILKDICYKPLCYAHILVGYIPVTKLTGMHTQATHCCGLANLYYACMYNVLDLINSYSKIEVPIMSSDGIWQCCHLIFANFIGDYPE